MRGRARHAGALRRCGRFERATPDFQAKLGYEVDKPGQADMTIASNAVRRRPARAALPRARLHRHLARGVVIGVDARLCSLCVPAAMRLPSATAVPLRACAGQYLLSVWCART